MVKRKKKGEENFWFKKCVEAKGAEWGWVPVNWRGWIALILLVGVNVFAANYFQINKLVLDSWSKFGVVFLVSLFVFIMVARTKTRGVKVRKR